MPTGHHAYERSGVPYDTYLALATTQVAANWCHCRGMNHCDPAHAQDPDVHNRPRMSKHLCYWCEEEYDNGCPMCMPPGAGTHES